MDWIPYDPTHLQYGQQYLIYYETDLEDGSIWHGYSVQQFGWVKTEYGKGFTKSNSPDRPVPVECIKEFKLLEFFDMNKMDIKWVCEIERPE